MPKTHRNVLLDTNGQIDCSDNDRQFKKRTKKHTVCAYKNLNYSSIFKDQRSVRSEQSELPVFYY